MNVTALPALLSPLDLVALGFLLFSFLALGWRIEHPGAKRTSVTIIMADYRREWMRQMVTRDPRIFDAAILTNLRQGTSFFASACMIAIGALLAAVGNADTLKNVALDLTLDGGPTTLWQVKLILVVLFLTHAFLKFVWANRLFGYCAVVMAAVPNEIGHELAYPRAKQAAEINIRAAWNFNRGLRAIYYALGSLAWLLGPYGLMLATAMVGYLIWEREFSSRPREILLADIPAGPKPAEPSAKES
jgi:uncharacterized membrane protein